MAWWAARERMDSRSGTGVRPAARVMITGWLTSGRGYSVFKDEAAPQKTKTALREEKKREKAAQEAARRQRERVANLETRIGDLEEEMTKLEIEMSDPDTYADTARAQNLSRRYDELQKKIAALYEEWEAAQS